MFFLFNPVLLLWGFFFSVVETRAKGEILKFKIIVITFPSCNDQSSNYPEVIFANTFDSSRIHKDSASGSTESHIFLSSCQNIPLVR